MPLWGSVVRLAPNEKYFCIQSYRGPSPELSLSSGLSPLSATLIAFVINRPLLAQFARMVQYAVLSQESTAVEMMHEAVLLVHAGKWRARYKSECGCLSNPAVR